MQYKVKAVAYMLGVNRRTVTKWINEGILPAEKKGKIFYILSEDLMKFWAEYESDIEDAKERSVQRLS
jgi:excisionase family DNA binding protein